MRILAKGKSANEEVFGRESHLPRVTILMAAHNEEKIISQKIESLLAQDYDKGKLSIYIGSDNSSDGTNAILSSLAKEDSQIHFFPFKERNGKPETINKLVRIVVQDSERTKDHIFLMTDASVIMDPSVVFHLVKHFKNDKVGLVDASMHYQGLKEKGISISEDTYLGSEVRLKTDESKVMGQMVGPFGGCYAIRSDLYDFVPKNHLVDDFYLALNVVKQKALVINEMQAKCYEPVSHSMGQEYKRKKRISTGNFQNLFAFKSLLNPFSSFGRAYLSHKVLRWLGPFFIGAIILVAIYFSTLGSFRYLVLSGLLLIWFVIIPLLDYLLSKVNLHIKPLRSISYFNKMNLALLHGFFNYLKGVDLAIWERTEREL